MLCPICRRENQANARFCIFCSSPLAIPESGSPQEQSRTIENEILQLRSLVALINKRLDALESMPGMAVTAPPPPVSAPEPSLPAVAVPIQETAPVPAEKIPLPEETPAEVKEKPARAREWEQVLGGNWLARIGVLALIIGVGFFLKYAFDNNWLGPAARVILGVIVGLFMLGLGNWWRRRYPVLTQVLSGGGIAVLYLSIFASSATYHLISIYIAIVFILVISIISTVLARRYDSMALAILGILGAFFAPFILGAFEERGIRTGGTGQAIQLLVYIIVIDLGVLLLATFRNWRWFTLLSLGCSLITYGFWYGEFHRQVSIATTEIGITAIFLIFVGATSLFHIIWRRIPQAFDYILMVLTAAAYFGISLGLMWDEFRVWMGGFVLLLAVFYGLLSYITYRRSPDNTRLSLFALGMAIVFLTTAIPIQFGDKAWTTVAWAAEGAVLIWLTFRARLPVFRYFGYIVFFIVAIRLFAFDTSLSRYNFQPVFNERFLAFIVAIASMWLSAFLLWRHRQEEKYIDSLVIMAAANFFTLWLIGAEVFTYSRRIMTVSASLSLIILLVLAGATILNHLIWRRKPHTLDIVLAVFNAAAFIIINIFIWRDLRAWMGLSYFLLALCYGILSYYALKGRADSTKPGQFAVIIALVFFTAGVHIQLGDVAWTTIIWAAEFVLLNWLSFRLKMPYLRNYCYVIFLAMAWRLLAFDTTINIRTFTPVLNERFLAFIISIAATYLTVYILRKNKDSYPEWHIPASTLLVFASFFSVWILSFEVWQSFSNPIRTATPAARMGLSNAQNLSLTTVWAIYAVAGLVIGIWKHWRAVRIGSLALLALPIVKVFVYDVFKLETSYRIGAFVGLGVLLLISAYLYQRYSKIIKGVFTEK
jgi:hypothetical protein